MSRILVTGASGFIGHYVVNELLNKKHQVIATSRSEEKARQQSWFGHVQYFPLDLSEFDDSIDYFNFFGQPDVMIHLAWEGLPNYTEAFHYEVNLPRHFSFLRNLLKNGLEDLTVTGTCFEYGMREGLLEESLPAQPANAYAKAKDMLRQQLEHLLQKSSFHFKWVRLFYMYGAGQSSKSLFSQLQTAIDAKVAVFNMSGGEQVRDFLPVEKVAENIVAIANQNEIEGVVNCCSGVPVTVKQLVEKIVQEQHTNTKLNFGYYPYPKHEPMVFWGDNKRLNMILNH